MDYFYRFIIGITNQISRFLAYNKYIRIRAKEKNIVFSWLLIEIMLIFTAFIFIYGIGKFGLAIDIFLGMCASVTIILMIGLIGLFIRDSHPEKKSKFKSIEHYLKKKNITIVNKKDEKFKELFQSDSFKKIESSLKNLGITDENGHWVNGPLKRKRDMSVFFSLIIVNGIIVNNNLKEVHLLAEKYFKYKFDYHEMTTLIKNYSNQEPEPRDKHSYEILKFIEEIRC